MIASAREEKRAMLTAPGEARSKLITQSHAEMAAARQAMLDYHSTFASQADADQWAGVEAQVEKVIGPREDVLKLLEQGKDAEARELAGTMTQAINDMNAALEEAGQFNADLAKGSADAAAQAGATARMILFATAAIAVITGVGLGWWLSSGISGAARKLQTAAVGIAQGDLDQDVSVRSRDEMGQMASAFGNMIEYLRRMAGAANSIADGDLTAQVNAKSARDTLGTAFVKMITNLREVIGETRAATEQLAQSREQLAHGAEQAAIATQEVAKTTSQVAKGSATQSSSAQEVSNGVAQLNSAITEILNGVNAQTQAVDEANALGTNVAQSAEQLSQGADTAAEGARNAADLARRGADAVREAVNGMNRIQSTVVAASKEVASLGARSEEIGKIVAVIDDIAAQTNLLALNAAIEAARAGDQGRGFAVVADEVRQLAERVANATKEIAGLIQGVQDGVRASVQAMDQGAAEVESGGRRLAAAEQSLSKILQAAQTVAQQISVITEVVERNSASTRQMQTAAGNVAEGITSISAVSEENSAAASRSRPAPRR
jgi:methyl-accepting chemotaxis protein